MKVKLLGTEIYISFLFCAVISLMLAFDRTGLVIPTLFASFIHETGHLFMMWVTGCQPRSVRLIPASVQIVRGFPQKKNGEIKIALAGPAVNLLLFCVLFFNYKIFGSKPVLSFAVLNLVVGIFNLLPVTGLDGGTVLIHLLSRDNNIARAVLTVKIITAVMCAAVFVFGVYLYLNGNFNLSVFIVALYLLLCVIIKY